MNRILFVLGITSMVFAIAGCANDGNSTASPGPSQTGGHDHDHDHTAKHGGHLIELGRNHEYHAELLDDHSAGKVTVWLMDSKMEPLAIDEPSVSLALTAGGQTQTFDLAAVSEDTSSEFSSTDAELMKLVKGEDVSGKLRVTINGTPFTGSFDHHAHDHDDHDDHDHDDHGDGGR